MSDLLSLLYIAVEQVHLHLWWLAEAATLVKGGRDTVNFFARISRYNGIIAEHDSGRVFVATAIHADYLNTHDEHKVERKLHSRSRRGLYTSSMEGVPRSVCVGIVAGILVSKSRCGGALERHEKERLLQP